MNPRVVLLRSRLELLIHVGGYLPGPGRVDHHLAVLAVEHGHLEVRPAGGTPLLILCVQIARYRPDRHDAVIAGENDGVIHYTTTACRR